MSSVITAPVGTRLVITSTRGHSFSIGQEVTVATPNYPEPDYCWAVDESGVGQYLSDDNARYAVVDPSTITDLDEFKRFVVREAMKAKKENNWCSEAEETLRRVGLGDLLPRERQVKIVHYVTLQQEVDESDRSVERRARRAVAVQTDFNGYRDSCEIVAQDA